MAFVSLPCRVCDSDSRDFLFQKNGWNIFCCKHCNFIYTDPIPTRNDLHKYYASGIKIDWRKEKKPKLIEHFQPKIIKNKFFEMRKVKSPRGRIWIRKRRLTHWDKYLPQKGRFLDVGCAEGYLVMAAQKKRKWDCMGLDIQIQRMKYACLHYADMPFLLGLADELCFKNEKFNIITMTHLLEHAFDPLNTLFELSRVLRRKGVLVITTPDIAHPMAKLRGKQWRRINPPVHLWYFSIKTLSTLIQKAGLKVIHNERSLLRSSVTVIGRKEL